MWVSVQLEHSKKRNDTAKVQSIEIELTTVSVCLYPQHRVYFYTILCIQQGSLCEHLKESVETQSHKLELYKVDIQYTVHT